MTAADCAWTWFFHTIHKNWLQLQACFMWDPEAVAVYHLHHFSVFTLQRRGKDPTQHYPEVILNNFTTRLGHSIGRLFAALFPQDPQFVGRQVATFHNQRDFIFFRFHRCIFKLKFWCCWEVFNLTLAVESGSFVSAVFIRWSTVWKPPLLSWHFVIDQMNICFFLWRYIFKNEKKVGIQELGPRFTLKLRSLQKGTFDSKFGEYEWVLKVSLRLTAHVRKVYFQNKCIYFFLMSQNGSDETGFL